MTTLTDEEWQTLYDGLDPESVLAAVDAVDALRIELSDGDDARPPEIRDNLLQLHRLAKAVLTNATPALIAEFFELADYLDDQVGQMMEAMEQLHGTLSAVMALYPERLSYDDEGES